MYRRLPKEEKLKIIRRINSGDKLARVCNDAGISRTIVYRWLRAYNTNKHQKISENILFPRKQGNRNWNRLPVKAEHKIIKTALRNPDYSPKKISSLVGVSPHGVWNVLKRKGLNTHQARSIYLYKNGESIIKPTQTNDKLTMIRRYEAGENVSNICKDFNISRALFYRWLKRYSQAESDKKRESLGNFRPKAERHYRFVPDAPNLVLQIVLEHPEYSAQKISGALFAKAGRKVLGNHGVHNLLTRLNLNTYQRRLLYAKQAQETVITPVPQVQEGWRVPIFGQIPSVSALAPPGFFNKLISSKFFIAPVTIIFLGFIFSVVLSNLGYGQGIVGKIGILFSFVALLFGMFFFIYSIKYYLTIAIVLSFSRRKEDRGDKGDKGAGGLKSDLSSVKLERHPFVSIHIASYNEKRVVERLLKAVSSMDYDNYEIVLVDDSTDETTQIIKDFLSNLGEIASSPDFDRDPRNDNSVSFLSSRGSGSDRGDLPNTPSITLIHRKTREGFKGGALKEALKHTDSRAEFVVVLDADFIPYPDTIVQFLKYFQATAGSLDFSSQSLNNADQNADQRRSALAISDNQRVAAIQGYQWHVLNKSENWITRGVRSEYAGSYVIERSGEEIYSGLKQISGSVYMIRRRILEQVGWGTSITEDFQLTLKLYEKGYKVVYTPYIQAPAEAVSTIKRLIRQRMRWAEGHSHNIRKMFVRLLFGKWEKDLTIEDRKWKIGVEGRSLKVDAPSSTFDLQNLPSTLNHLPSKQRTWTPSPLTFPEKLEFLYLSPYYLQAAFFIFGTLSWFIAETIFKVRLPFWTEIWGWSLVFTNLLALPLMNMVGLFMEESEERDYLGLISFIILSYIVAPFQGYAAIKGFLTHEEGPWFRTPKTGKITDTFIPGRLYRFVRGIFGRPQVAPSAITRMATNNERIATNTYLSLATANNTFDTRVFKSAGKRVPWFGKSAVACMLIASMLLSYLSFFVPLAKASPGTQVKTVEFMITQYNSATDIANGNGVAATDYSDDVGTYNSIALGSDGFARIATYDVDGGDLRYIACSNASCTTQSVNLDVDTSNNVGQYTSMFLASDLPTISYYDVTATALKLARCTGDGADAGSTACDATGEWTLTTVDNATSANTGQYTSIARASDTFPRIAYYDLTNLNLLFVQCDDLDCSGTGETITTVESTSDVGTYTSLVLDASDNAMISYYLDSTSDDLRYVLCTNNSCSTVDADTPRTLYSTGISGLYTSIARASDGFPRISFYGAGAATTLDLLFIQCGSADCVTVTATTEVETTNDIGQYSSLVLNSSDLARIAYYDVTNFQVRYIACTNAACSTGTPAALDGGTAAGQSGKVGTYIISAWKSSDDTVRIVYDDSENNYVMFIQCTATDCSTRNMTIPDVGEQATGNDVSVTIDLPESGITVRKAIVEWRTLHSGVPNNRTAVSAEMRFYRSGQTPTRLRMGRQSVPSTTTGTSDEGIVFVGTAEDTPMVFRMEAASQIAAGSNSYSFNATMWGLTPRNVDSAKIYITYEYDDSSATQLKTVRYFAGQGTGSDQNNIDTTINPNITEGSASIKQHFFEITGVYDDNNTTNDITVNAGFATGACGTPTTSAVAVITGARGTTYDYLTLFDASATTPTLAGNNCIRHNVTGTTARAGLKAAEWVITYSYSYYSLTGDDTTHVKTVRYFVGQASGDLATTQTTIATITFNLPESSISLKSVYTRYWFTHDAASTLTPEICEGATCTTGSAHTVPLETTSPEQTGGDVLLYDVTTHFTTNWANGDSFAINAASGTANTIESVGAEVIITYTYDALNTTTGIKTIWWWVGQQYTRSTANFTQATSDSTGDLFDTYLPETGTKTLRSAGVIGNFLNDVITTTAKLPDVKIDSAEAGTSETSASFLLTNEANSIVIIHKDTGAANPQMTNATQTGIDFTICPPSNTSGCSGTSPIASNRSAIGYSTYESTVPAAPESLVGFLFLAPFVPAIVSYLQKRRRVNYGQENI